MIQTQQGMVPQALSFKQISMSDYVAIQEALHDDKLKFVDVTGFNAHLSLTSSAHIAKDNIVFVHAYDESTVAIARPTLQRQ